MRVVVIGGGVIGLCVALELSRAGADVLVVDRERDYRGSSVANAGWVVPVLAAPLAGPAVLGTLARRMFRPDSPVLVRPWPSAGLLRWCVAFLRSTPASRYREGVRALLGLGARSVELFDRLRTGGVDFEVHRRGLLMVARTEGGLRETIELADTSTHAGYGGHVEVLDAAAVRSREPAASDEVVGAVYAASEIHVRPETVMAGLTDALARLGIPVRRGVQVRGIDREPGARWSVATSTGSFSADRVVIAAGTWSAGLLRGLGTSVPVQPGKGYVITATGAGTTPRHPMKLVEDNVACTPFDGALRIAGRFELGATAWHIRPRAVHQMITSASRYLRDLRPGWDSAIVTGFRPATPDGLPIIGRVPSRDGVFVATGHGMLGLTLAPATAHLLAPLVLHDREAAELTPFTPTRFHRTRS